MALLAGSLGIVKQTIYVVDALEDTVQLLAVLCLTVDEFSPILGILYSLA